MGFFDSLADLAGNIATVIVAPVEIVVDVASAVTKPLADGAEALKDTVKDLTK